MLGRIQEFNKDLAQEEVLFDIKEYMSQVKLRFGVNVDLGLYDSTFSGNEFSLTEEMVPGGIDIRKILKSKKFKNGVDYIVVRRSKKICWFHDTQYRMTGNALKKALLMSGESEYVNYFLFIESIVRNYYQYQKQYERKTMLESKKKLDDFERMANKTIEFSDF